MKVPVPVLVSWLTATLMGCADMGPIHTPSVEKTHFSNGTAEVSTSTNVVLQALSYVGVRYTYGGDSPATGFDCSGLVSRVFNQAAGLILPHDSREISRIGEKVAPEELEPGDLVFFNTLRQPFSHVGIYLGEQRFIHAPGRGGHVEIVNMSGDYWRKHYNGARRIAVTR